MNTARLALIASTVLAGLGLVAAAWALAAPGSAGTGSGGARAIPVVPSSGGGSEPAPDDASQQGIPVPPASEVPPPLAPPPAAPQDAPTETLPEEDLAVPLEDEDSEPPSGGAPAQEGTDSSGGAFSF